MFVGRKKELNTLNKAYSSDGFQMIVLYGRRRIGKSTLLREFIKDKKAIFYTCTKIGKKNVDLFSSEVLRVLDPDLKDIVFASLDAVLSYITEKIKNEKQIIIIDELPYWAEKDDSVLSVFQKYIDEFWLNQNIMLVFCGSSLSFMEEKVLSEKSPVFGRRTAQIKLEPFNYIEAGEFTPGYTAEEKAICYGITGGVAKYLSLINPKESLDENIISQFFETDGYLFEETKNLLTQEFNEISTVNNIIEQVADGENTLNAIADKCHEKDATVLYSLERLCNVGLVEKKHCITEENNKKKTMYVLKDTMFKFWYQFVPKGYSIIEMGYGRQYYMQAVKPKLHDYMGYIFEEMCRYYLFQMSMTGKLGVFLTETGSWWGTEVIQKDKKKTVQATDIDVVGLSSLEKSYVAGECKFKNEKIDKSIYETLVSRVHLIHTGYELKKLILFSLSGFTEWFDTLDDEKLIRVTLEDMYQ